MQLCFSWRRSMCTVWWMQLMQNIFHSAKATNSLYLKCCSRKFKLSGYLIKWNFNLKKMNAQYIAFFKHKSTSNLINLVNLIFSTCLPSKLLIQFTTPLFWLSPLHNTSPVINKTKGWWNLTPFYYYQTNTNYHSTARSLMTALKPFAFSIC